MADPRLYEQAAAYYHQAGLVTDAARCYRLAGAHRRAADLYASLGDYREAAVDYERAGMTDLGAWLLVHRAGDADAARAMATRLTAVPAGAERATSGRRTQASAADAPAPSVDPPLRGRLVLSRCDVADGALPHTILPVIDTVCADLAAAETPHDRFVEEWAVALAEHVHRYDQVALVFAAAVRGRRFGAAERWQRWAARVLDTELTIPRVADPSPPAGYGTPARVHVFARDDLDRYSSDADYHRPGCRRLGSEPVYSMSLDTAIAGGRSPCVECRPDQSLAIGDSAVPSQTVPND